MADSLIIKVDLDAGDASAAFGSLEKQAVKSGEVSARNYSKSFDDSLSGLLETASKLAGILTGVAGAFSFGKAISEAINQENAVNRLNVALQNTGQYTAQASQDLQAYASSLQLVTKYGDDAILNAQAMIQALGNLSQGELKQATKATLDLASALRIDLDTAAKLVGKAANGNVDALSRYGFQVQKATTDSETFANALKIIESRFGGAANKDLNTFSGQLQQLSNNFYDALKSFGLFIIQNPFVIKALQLINSSMISAVNSVTKFLSGINTFDDLITPVINFGNALITYVVAPLELVYNAGKLVFKLMVSGLASIISAVAQIGGIAGDMMQKLGIGGGLAQALIDFSESSTQVADESATAVVDSFKSITDFPLSESLVVKNEELRAGLAAFNMTINESAAVSQSNIKTLIDEQVGWYGQIKEVIGGVQIGFASFSKDAELRMRQISQQAQQMAGILKGAMVQGISGGIQNVVTSLMKGESAFKNFGKFVMNTFGDLAIQLGQFFIAQGIAIEATKAISGTGAIAAGAALVALGTILKNFSGGGSPAAASGGGAQQGQLVTPSGQTTSETTSPENIERTKPKTEVNLVVQGSLVQQEELGKYISDVLSESGAKNGTSIFNTRFA